MPVQPRHSEIPRKQVNGWITAWNANHQGKTLEEYIAQEVKKLKLDDNYVHTFGDGMDQWSDDATHIADMIIADLPSYGVVAQQAILESRNVHAASSGSEGT